MSTTLSLTLPVRQPNRGLSSWTEEYRRAMTAAYKAEKRLLDLRKIDDLRKLYG